MPLYVPDVTEDVLSGGVILRRAFLKQPFESAARQGSIISARDRNASVVLIRRGVVFQSSVLPDGRRAIVDAPTWRCSRARSYRVRRP
jgi:hypothetical protein